MLLVGLTGGLASGKTTVAKFFQQCGAEIIDADQVARAVVKPGKPAWKDLVKTFGKEILNDDRTINRQALAARVFHEPKRLKRLNQIVHPRVAHEQARIAKEIVRRNPDAVIIYDAALLIEANAHERMDWVVVVTANQQIQLARACKRDGFSRREALARIRGQLPLREKKRVADDLIDGTMPRAQLRRRIQNLYRELSVKARRQTPQSERHARQ